MTDRSASFRYPTLVRRYLATAIDLCLGFVSVGAVGLLPVAGDRLVLWRAIVLLAYFATYEPLLTASGGTVGQRLLGLRVRRADEPDRTISVQRAYVRYGVKYALGIISFVTLPFAPQQRAVHDLVADSVMLKV
jgi:uncharacterized RDD family membrane protein YckC